MQARRNLIRPALAVLAIGAAALAILLLPSRGVSIDWGDGEWLVTSYANSHSALCTQNDPNGRCKEWCDFGGGGFRGTGELCCVGTDGICHPSNIFYP